MIKLVLRLTLMIIVLALWLGFIGIILISDARPIHNDKPITINVQYI